MKRYFELFRNIASVLVVCALLVGVGYLIGGHNVKEVKVVETQNTGIDLKMPMEVEKRKVTVEEVESRLLEIDELSTYSGTYSMTYGKEESRYLFRGVVIPGTTNGLTIRCNGVVKIGYNLSDISVSVGEDKIFISLPPAKINSNYVIWDTMECKEENCILNPIQFSQYKELVTEIESKGLENVENNGIYELAEYNLKKLIDVFLSEYTEYEVVYL